MGNHSFFGVFFTKLLTEIHLNCQESSLEEAMLFYSAHQGPKEKVAGLQQDSISSLLTEHFNGNVKWLKEMSEKNLCGC